MKLTYKGILRDAYLSPKRRVFAFGQIIDFTDGVADGLSESIARELLNRKIIKEYTPNYPLEPVDELEAAASLFVQSPKVTEFVEVNSNEQAQPDFTDEQLTDMGDVEPTQEVDIYTEYDLPTLPEFEDENSGNEEITKELLEELYSEFGTWTAVANHLGITTTRLKKYRDEFGL
jgi:hypothetical protein